MPKGIPVYKSVCNIQWFLIMGNMMKQAVPGWEGVLITNVVQVRLAWFYKTTGRIQPFFNFFFNQNICSDIGRYNGISLGSKLCRQIQLATQDSGLYDNVCAWTNSYSNIWANVHWKSWLTFCRRIAHIGGFSWNFKYLARYTIMSAVNYYFI